MDTSVESRVVRDVERQLSRLVARSPRLAELPVAPLLEIDDLVRLELALERFAQVHRSGRSRQLVETIRAILSVARTRLRMAGVIEQAVAIAEGRRREALASR